MNDKLLQFKGTIYENGYGLVAKQTMKNNNLSLGAKAVYSYICAYAGNDGQSFPSINLILHELNITKKTYYKYMDELVYFKYITKEKVRNKKGKFDNNIYIIENIVPMVENLPHGKKSTEEILPCGTKVPTTNNNIYTINNTNTNNKDKENNPIWVYQQNIFPTPGKIDVDAITNWAKQLGADLVIYAIELAVKNNVRRLTYIEKILIDWDIHAVKTVDQAKAYTTKKSKEREKGGSSKCNASNKPHKNAGAERADAYDFSNL